MFFWQQCSFRLPRLSGNSGFRMTLRRNDKDKNKDKNRASIPGG